MRVLIVDDHPLVCSGLEVLIKTRFFGANVDSVHDVEGALTSTQLRKYDLLIIDIELNFDNGFELYAMLKRRNIEAQVIFLSSKKSLSYAANAKSLGASGYIDKSEGLETVMKTVSGVLRGETHFPTESGLGGLESRIRLSNRERAVLALLAQGVRNKQIARELSINEKTVSTYKQRILKKYGVNSLIELLAQNDLNLR